MASPGDLAARPPEPAPSPGAPATPATMAEVLTSIEADAEGSEGFSAGLHRTGFDVLDHVLEGGLQAGHLTLVGGPPGVGKTVATLQWARNIALAGNPVIFLCYEHDERALFSRVLQMEAGLLPQGDQPGQPRELRRTLRSVVRAERSMQEEVAGNLLLRAACARVAKYQHQLALVRGNARLSPADIAEMVTARSGEQPVLFVDYLQKVAVDGAVSEDDRIATLKPSCASLRAESAPIPLPPAVTSATFSFDIEISSSFFRSAQVAKLSHCRPDCASELMSCDCRNTIVK